MVGKIFVRSLLISIIPASLLMVSGGVLASISTTQYSYDVANGTVTRTEPTLKKIKYSYDSVNRIEKIELLDSPNIPTFGFEYDLTSQLKKITSTSPVAETIFGYDDFDRLNAITDFGETTPILRFKYDHKDRLTWITYPGNGRVCYEYDADGRLTRTGRLYSDNIATTCDAANEITDYRFDVRGRLDGISYPNGISRYVKYNEFTGQIEEVGYKKVNGGLIFSDRYEYVPASRLYASIKHTTAVSSGITYYKYDINERVKTVTEPNGRRTEYTYDAFGNRTEEKIINIKKNTENEAGRKPYGTYTYQYYTNGNRLHYKLFNGVVIEEFIYDAAGRITSRVHATDGTTTYTYDDRGMLTGLTKPGYVIKMVKGSNILFNKLNQFTKSPYKHFTQRTLTPIKRTVASFLSFCQFKFEKGRQFYVPLYKIPSKLSMTGQVAKIPGLQNNYRESQ